MRSASANNSLKWKFCSSENGLKLHEILYLSRDCSHLVAAFHPLHFSHMTHAGIFSPCFCRHAFRAYGNAARFSERHRNVNDRARRDLPVRRTKGYKAFANGMIRELFASYRCNSMRPRTRTYIHSRIHARIKNEPKVVTFRKSFAFSFITISVCILSCWRFILIFFLLNQHNREALIYDCQRQSLISPYK